MVTLSSRDLFKVRTLPQLASHAKKLTLDETYKFQIIFIGKRITLPISKTVRKDLTKNNPFLASFQTTLSLSFLLTNFPLSMEKKVSMISNSQSLKFLVKRRIQRPSPPVSSHRSATQASFDTTNWNQFMFIQVNSQPW